MLSFDDLPWYVYIVAIALTLVMAIFSGLLGWLGGLVVGFLIHGKLS